MHMLPTGVAVPSHSDRSSSCWLLLLVLASLGIGACDRNDQQAMPTVSGSGSVAVAQSEDSGKSEDVDLPKADQRLCTAVVILLDRSGSMAEKVSDPNGAKVAKHLIARSALEKIIGHTGEWKKSHPDRVLQMSLFSFSDKPQNTLPMADFDFQTATKGLDSVAKPKGGTAIGLAISEAFKALYASGCTRKYIICITDGENTVGVSPDVMARRLFKQTGGEVEIHFVAFDTSPEKFSFLSEVNGHVVQASGSELDARLSDIYERRILAETMPAEK